MALQEFYGEECPHCVRMHTLVERLEDETQVHVERFEVWHNEQNAALFQKADQGNCGGVPYFWNSETNKSICGEVSYDALKKWAEGKK